MGDTRGPAMEHERADSSSELRETPETATEGKVEQTGGVQEGAQRPWWRRFSENPDGGDSHRRRV
jgi:hypothetical protein